MRAALCNVEKHKYSVSLLLSAADKLQPLVPVLESGKRIWKCNVVCDNTDTCSWLNVNINHGEGEREREMERE